MIYNNIPNSKGSGKIIVPPIVKEFAYNERYIIAKSIEVDEFTGKPQSEDYKYWVIDKFGEEEFNNPMDSITFVKILKSKNINLTLK